MGAKVDALEIRLARVRAYSRRSKSGREILVREHETKREANRVAMHARLIEPEATANMKRLSRGAGAKMVGLEHRLKDPASLQRKIAADADADYGGDRNQAAAHISDATRYTMVLDHRHYTAGTRQVLAQLEHQGYKTRTKNFWEPGDDYQGVNVALTHPSGAQIELQFHTPESLAAKEKAHTIYEKFRTSTDLAEKRTLYKQMIKIMKDVPEPPGWETLPNRKIKPFPDLPGMTSP